MKLMKNASEDDIRELKERLNKRKEQRILERDLLEVIGIVNKHNLVKGVIA